MAVLRCDAARTWPRSLQLLALAISIVEALVAVPERRPATAFTRQANPTKHRLFLETSSLIGGPSWLPLHVKVILENDESIHRWDFVPLNATDTSTLQQLLILQAVPAEIRYRQRDAMPSKQRRDQANGVIFGYDVVLEGIDDNGLMAGADDVALVATQKAATERLIQKAHAFCSSYELGLHLIQNNCWTFAFQLYDHLSEESTLHAKDFAGAASDVALEPLQVSRGMETSTRER